MIASLMVESKRESWHEMVRRAEDAGSDALELNFGCPHGMSERGMGSAVGQVPEYTEMITSWVKEAAKTPGDRQAHAQCHRHYPHCLGRRTRRRRRRQPDEHDQFTDGRGPGDVSPRGPAWEANPRMAAIAGRR